MVGGSGRTADPAPNWGRRLDVTAATIKASVLDVGGHVEAGAGTATGCGACRRVRSRG